MGFGSDFLTALGAGLNPMAAQLLQRQQELAFDRDTKAKNKATVQEQLKALIGSAPTEAVPFNPEASPLLPVAAQVGTGVGANMTQEQVANLQNLASVSPESALKGISGQLFPQNNRLTAKKSFAPVTIFSPDTNEKRLVIPTVDSNTGEATLNPTEIPEGFELAAETGIEKRAGQVDAASRKVTSVNKVKRQQNFIDSGIESADKFANVQRAIELLDSVGTGGFNNASLKAKQFFGIESADEAELSNRLGQAVLQQLKPIFGSAFSENEGKRLFEISQSYGKSTAGNRRLLKQIRAEIERSARRGSRAARSQGDTEAAKQIEEALKFRLSPTKETTLKNLATQQPSQSIDDLVNKYAN